MANEVRIDVTSRDRSAPGFRSARSNADELSESTRRVGEVAAGVLASGVFERIAASAVQAFTTTIAAASGLEQAVGGTEAVFGDASAAIDTFAQTSAESVGLSERAFREATTLIGGQLKRMTQDVEFASDASIQLVQVGADLAATYGGTTKEAVDAFAAALRGEADPAERFNLNLKISEVNAKAVELGLAKTTDEVDDNARAQALLALVMEQSADAQGQFARETDSHAGATQRMTAAVENAQATFGQKLLPVLAAASDLAIDALSGFEALPGPLQAVVGVLAAAAALTPGILALRAAMVALGISIRGVLLAAGPAGAVIAALSAALVIVGRESSEAEERQRTLADMMRAVAAAAEEERRQVAATALQQSDIKDTADELGISLSTLTDIVLGNTDAEERLRRRLVQVRDQRVEGFNWTRKSAGAMLEERSAAEVLIAWLDSVDQASDQVEDEQRELADATGDTTSAIDVQIESLEALADELHAQLDPVFAFTEATRDLEDAQKAVTEAEEEHGKKSPEYRDALRAEQRAALDVLAAAGALGDEFTGRLSKAQRRMLRDAGLSADAIDDLERQMRQAKRRARDLDGTRVRINEEYRRRIITERIFRDIYYREEGGRIPLAHGGVVGAERGMPHGGVSGAETPVMVNDGVQPEAIDLPNGSRVIPSLDQAFDRNQLATGAAEQVLEVHVVSSGDEVIDAIVRALSFRVRTDGAGSVEQLLGSSR